MSFFKETEGKPERGRKSYTKSYTRKKTKRKRYKRRVETYDDEENQEAAKANKE